MRQPNVPVLLFPVPKDFPPPVAIGDKLPDGRTIGPLCDRFNMGGKTIWRFYVSDPPPKTEIRRRPEKIITEAMAKSMA
jgi:hypothetical protein